MKFILEHIDQLILIAIGLFIAFNPSSFVKGFGQSALKTQKLVRIMGISLVVIFVIIMVYPMLKK